MDQDNSAKKSTETDSQSDVPSDASIISSKQDGQPHEGGSAKEQEPRQRWTHQLKAAERLKSDWVVAIATVVIACASIAQYVMSERQWKTANEALIVSRASTDAAARAASIAEKAMKSGQQSFEATIAGMQTQSKIAKQTADAAGKAADVTTVTLEDSKSSFEMTMRPYVTIYGAQFTGPRDGQMQVRCIIRNNGRTPAADLRGVAEFVGHPKTRPLVLPAPRNSLRRAGDIGSNEIGLTYIAEAMPRKLVDELIQRDDLTFIFYGDVSFDSRVFSERTPYDTVKFCFYYSRETKSFSRCTVPEYGKVFEIQ